MPDITLSVVVPVYNSEHSLPLLSEALAEILPSISSAFELILVNDSSKDGSWKVIQDLTQQYAWITGIDLMRNYGQHSALLCGIRAAHHEIIVTIDDDLQHPPSEIIKLLDKLSEGYDVVYGVPAQEQHGLFRNWASQITKLALQGAMGAEIARHVSAFRVFRTEIRAAFANYQSPYVSIDVLLTWGTTRFAAVKVKHDARRFGQSNYTFRKLVTHAFNMMTGFSVWPLQAASTVGFAFTFFGILVFIYVIGRFVIEGGSVPGFPFLASIIAIFGGVQLFALGIIGEYLARMHFRLMDRPAYAVRKRIS
ncbi:undecaprenyl-phosphate 4-deoxy-4-formamido-L-arabinose transferase [Anaerolineae bacterium]|nr:undecaprenyl-phosphate 4-deoxy-4-formamido-L-arabinose transferase [Anaerolineae bacterium]